MGNENVKYDDLIRLIQKNRPEMKHPDIVAEKIMDELQKGKSESAIKDIILEFLFGWIYIGWVRKSMIIAAAFFVLLFGYQQAVILRRINELSAQRINDGTLFMRGTERSLSERAGLFRLSGRDFAGKRTSVSKKDIDEMIKSINTLQIKYQDLIDQIKDDPELKEYIEKRMRETGKLKN
jgi:hypothetical protein